MFSRASPIKPSPVCRALKTILWKERLRKLRDMIRETEKEKLRAAVPKVVEPVMRDNKLFTLRNVVDDVGYKGRRLFADIAGGMSFFGLLPTTGEFEWTPKVVGVTVDSLMGASREAEVGCGSLKVGMNEETQLVVVTETGKEASGEKG